MASGAEQPRVGVIMGSDSDLGTMKEAGRALRDHGLVPKEDYEFGIVSAHRTTDFMIEYTKGAEERGLQVIIPGAGGSAHLPGMVASETRLPVLGVAVTSTPTTMNPALGSLIRMPEGKPLATFQATRGAYAAGRMASQILAQVNSGANRVAVISGSDDEQATMQHAARALERLGLVAGDDFEEGVFGNEKDAGQFCKQISARGLAAIIVASSHKHRLPSYISAHANVPILGVALPRSPDVMSPSLHDLVNPMEHQPIAAFQSAGGSFNAALKAVRILALSNPDLRPRIDEYNEELATTNMAKHRIMQRLADEGYDELSDDERQQLIDVEVASMNTTS